MNQPVKRKHHTSKNAPRVGHGPARIIFVTGTDTGVGKTILAGLLVNHLRSIGCHALAMKPFCSGGRADVRLLRAMQDAELSEEEINPFYFPEPIAPLVSARKHKRVIALSEVVRRIKEMAARCECLLIEGSGGLLVPLGERYLVSDLIRRLNCEVIVVSRNRLGTINHTLLTVATLKNLRVKNIVIALMDVNKTDVSCATNAKLLSELLAPIPIRQIDFIRKNPNKIAILKKSCKKIKKTLAQFFP
jgi:dethiobiotin synthetase